MIKSKLLMLLTSPSKRHCLGKTYWRENACQDQAKEGSWGTGHEGSLQDSCSVELRKLQITSQQAQVWHFFVEILGHISAFWSNKNLWDWAKHPVPDEQNCSENCAKNTAPVSSQSSSSREVFPTLKHHQHAEDKGHVCQQCFWNRYHGTTALSKSNLPRIRSWLANIVCCVPAGEVTRREWEHPRSLETMLCQTLRHLPCSE